MRILVANSTSPITKPESVQKPGFDTSGLTGVQPTAPNDKSFPPDPISPKTLTSKPECVPGYHWDNSQQECVADSTNSP
jgi:hypothetical protein